MDNLTNLESLFVGFNELTKLENMGHLQNLKELYAWSNKIADLDGLMGLQNLRILKLSKNKLTNIDALKTLKSIEELDLKSNEIENAECLGGLVNLEKLELGANKLKGDISYLQSLTSLKFLDLGSYKINDFSVFQNFSAPIGQLYLNNTGMAPDDIKYIAGNENFQNNLFELSLGANYFGRLNFSFLSELRNLDRLRVGINNLSHIEGLDKTRVWIDFSYNNLPLTEVYKLFQMKIIAQKQENVFFESITLKVHEPLILPEQEMAISNIETGIYVTGPVSVPTSKIGGIVADKSQEQLVEYKKNRDYIIRDNSVIFLRPGYYYIHMVSRAMRLQQSPQILMSVKTGLITVEK